MHHTTHTSTHNKLMTIEPWNDKHSNFLQLIWTRSQLVLLFIIVHRHNMICIRHSSIMHTLSSRWANLKMMRSGQRKIELRELRNVIWALRHGHVKLAAATNWKSATTAPSYNPPLYGHTRTIATAQNRHYCICCNPQCNFRFRLLLIHKMY